jgi:arsenate reductase
VHHEPIKTHWDTANPAAVRGTDEDVRRAFESTLDLLRRRIEAFLQLPLDSLDRAAQWRGIMRIGEIH